MKKICYNFLKGLEEGIQQGKQQGIQQGIQQGKKEVQIELILRLLERRLGGLSPDLQTQIGQLSSEKLENLSETLLDMTNLDNLILWLQTQS
jgi:flagellar biosynthesis/type III secretory pathway protein FliH